MTIIIEYDGSFPNLCRGQLLVIINGEKWFFPDCCLKSGGYVFFDKERMEHIESGPWTIEEWPENFPEELKDKVTEAVNEGVSKGCCGGCV